jgi:hypothetical protein
MALDTLNLTCIYFSSSFGQAATTSSSGGGTFVGSMLGGLGGQPSAERASTNVFSSTSFGSSSTTSSACKYYGICAIIGLINERIL